MLDMFDKEEEELFCEELREKSHYWRNSFSSGCSKTVMKYLY